MLLQLPSTDKVPEENKIFYSIAGTHPMKPGLAPKNLSAEVVLLTMIKVKIMLKR